MALEAVPPQPDFDPGQSLQHGCLAGCGSQVPSSPSVLLRLQMGNVCLPAASLRKPPSSAAHTLLEVRPSIATDRRPDLLYDPLCLSGDKELA